MWGETGTRRVWGEAGNAISELCDARATKIVCVVVNNDRGALLSSWGQTVKHRSENLFRQLQTETCTIRREGNGALKPDQGSVCNEAVNAIRKMCAVQATKRYVGGSGLGCYRDPAKPTLDNQ